MGKFLRIVNGIPRMIDESGTPTIYDDYLVVVASGASGPNEINLADVGTGSPISLPNGGDYESDELEIYLNGNRIEDVVDYNWQGSGTRT